MSALENKVDFEVGTLDELLNGFEWEPEVNNSNGAEPGYWMYYGDASPTEAVAELAAKDAEIAALRAQVAAVEALAQKWQAGGNQYYLVMGACGAELAAALQRKAER